MFIVTGSGHSGTGWASQLFTKLGYPCGHETYFNFRVKDQRSDSSWMAVPYLDQTECPLVRLVRDPFKVVKSFYRSGTYRDVNTSCKYTQFTYRHLPGLYDTDELGRCILRTCDWDNPVEAFDHLTVQIEDRSHKSLRNMIYYCTGDRVPFFKIEKVLLDIGKEYNAHGKGNQTKLSADWILDHPLGYKLVERADKFGYKLGA